MNSSATDSFAALEARIGYRFRDPKLLEEALTHASLAGEAAHNERMEFLGDRVLGLLAAEALLHAFPDATEGEIAPRLNALVRKEACASVARGLGLGPHIRAGGIVPGSAVLADACEALIAALYLDAGLEAARAFFAREWGVMLAGLEVAPTDAKSALQEWTQERALGLPAYRLVSQEGPHHEPRFTVEVGVRSLAPAIGEGASKRAAEQAAAEALLLREGIWSPRP